EWPAMKPRPCPPWLPAALEDAWFSMTGGSLRPRSKAELVEELNAELSRNLIGVDWNFSQNIRDNVMEVLSGVKGENSAKIIGDDLDELERVAEQVKNTLAGIKGIDSPGVFRIKGQTNLELAIDREKCARWN